MLGVDDREQLRSHSHRGFTSTSPHLHHHSARGLVPDGVVVDGVVVDGVVVDGLGVTEGVGDTDGDESPDPGEVCGVGLIGRGEGVTGSGTVGLGTGEGDGTGVGEGIGMVGEGDGEGIGGVGSGIS